MIGMNRFKSNLPYLVRHHRLVFFLALYVAYVVTLFWVGNVRDVGDPGRTFARLALPAVELLLLGMVCAACMRMATGRPRRWPWMLPTGLIAFMATAVYLVQIYSIRISNNFISVLALQNADSVAFVQSPRLALAAMLAVAWVSLFLAAAMVASAAPPGVRRPVSERWRPGLFAAVFAFLALVFAYAVSLQDKNARLEPGFRQAPVVNLVANLYRASTTPVPDMVEPPAGLIGDAQCFRYSEDAVDSGYPFQRRSAFQATLSLKNGKMPGKPNVIIIFAEGISARLVGAYGGRYPGLTPHIDRLAARSMRVDDYFNHTAATFRGLIGQLSSGYSYAGGGGAGGWTKKGAAEGLSRISRQTLPLVANAAGYDTHFFAPHRAKRPIIKMLRSMGFTHVHTFESIDRDWLDGRGVVRAGTAELDDESLFSGVIDFLKAREAAGNKQPFLLATYNIGTHAFLPRAEDEIPYGDGSNVVLDKVHNFDRAFGEFLAYFEASGFADDTVLFVTSDHATYPGPLYREVAGEDLKPFFVDRIPLLVLDPFHDLPVTLDAGGRNSLDLTPTVLQLSGMQTRANAFLGTSLFEQRNLATGVSALASEYYMTSPEGVFAMGEVPGPSRPGFNCAVTVVRRFYESERRNRIFPSSDTDADPGMH